MMKKRAIEWLKSAELDLLSAKDDIGKEWATPLVAYHSQQCVEKSFKAIVELFGKDVPKTHDLIKLYHICREIIPELHIENVELLEVLNKVYIDVRYPGPLGFLPEGAPTQLEAESFLIFAEEIYEKVKEIVYGMPL